MNVQQIVLFVVMCISIFDLHAMGSIMRASNADDLSDIEPNNEPSCDNKLKEFLESHQTQLRNSYKPIYNTLDKLSMNKDDLHEFGSDDLRKILINVNLEHIHITRLISLLRKIPGTQISKESVIIVLTQDEEKALKKINNIQTQMKTKIGTINNTINALSTNFNTTQTQINSTFDNIIKILKSKQNEMLNELIRVKNEKHNILSNQMDELTTFQSIVNNDYDTTQNIIHNTSISPEIRKNRIIQIAENLSHNTIQMDTTPNLKFLNLLISKHNYSDINYFIGDNYIRTINKTNIILLNALNNQNAFINTNIDQTENVYHLSCEEGSIYRNFILPYFVQVHPLKKYKLSWEYKITNNNEFYQYIQCFNKNFKQIWHWNIIRKGKPAVIQSISNDNKTIYLYNNQYCDISEWSSINTGPAARLIGFNYNADDLYENVFFDDYIFNNGDWRIMEPDFGGYNKLDNNNKIITLSKPIPEYVKNKIIYNETVMINLIAGSTWIYPFYSSNIHNDMKWHKGEYILNGVASSFGHFDAFRKGTKYVKIGIYCNKGDVWFNNLKFEEIL
eukprot:56746_1